MTTFPSISVIVICRNAAAFIEGCLTSIRRQTHSLHEIIVVDGHSTDGTRQWLEFQSDIHLLQQQGTGIANARNRGIEAATGDIIAFLDADDTWTSNKTALQVDYLVQNPAANVVTGLLQKSTEERLYTALTPGGCCFRREVFNTIGHFNETLVVAADHEWFIRAKRKGEEVRKMDELVLHKTMHDRNMSIVRQDIYRRELLELFVSSQNPTP
ncbi:glycosyltransferase [Runella sp.]|uniref:glycosyltransferase n=1 Tax=Runella sp. TaxID=1960881 RepID=UPI003D0C9869